MKELIEPTESHYLASLINLEKWYAVEYTINQRGERTHKYGWVLGKDLTAPQIQQLHNEGAI